MIETYFIVFVVFAFGAAIGSFLHVVAERNVVRASSTLGVSPLTPSVFPARKPIGKTPGVNAKTPGVEEIGVLASRSICPQCKKKLTAKELVPIFSYIFQRGRCQGCKNKIPMHYVGLEVLSGFLCIVLLAPALLAHHALGLPILYYIAACLLIILIHIDARSMMLPDRFIIIVGLIAFIIAVLSGKTGDDMALGVLAGAGLIYAIWLATAGQGIGFGDVKLMIPLGILFGLQGLVTLLFISFFIGGFIGIVMLATKQATRKTAIPFGPFLAGAALLLLLFPNIPDLFFGLIGV